VINWEVNLACNTGILWQVGAFWWSVVLPAQLSKDELWVHQVNHSEITDIQQTFKDTFIGLIMDQASLRITTLTVKIKKWFLSLRNEHEYKYSDGNENKKLMETK